MKALMTALLSLTVCSLLLCGCQRRDAELPSSVPALLDCLRNDNNNPYYRGKVIIELNQIGSAGVDKLFEACEDENPKVRSGVIRALGCPNPKYERHFTAEDDRRAFPLLVRAMEDPEPQVRAAAAEAFFKVSRGSCQEELALPYLIKALEDPSNEVRSEAAHSIALLARLSLGGKWFTAAVPRLAALCAAKEIDLRNNAAWALREIGAEAAPAAPALVRALLDDDHDRCGASESLIEIGNGARERVLPLLIQSLKDTKAAPKRLNILYTLRRIGSLPRSIVPLLAATVKDDSPEVQSLAAIVLGDMGPRASDALPTLRAVRGAPLEVRLDVARAVYKIAGDNRPQLIRIALAALEDDERYTREAGESILYDLEPPAKEAGPVLTRVAREHPNEKVREAAENVLRRLHSP